MSLNPFQYQPPDEEQIEVIMKVRRNFKELYDLILETVPECSERTLAIRRIEEGSMWINKAVAFKGEKYL